MFAVLQAGIALVRREGISNDLAMGLVFGLLLLAMVAAATGLIYSGNYMLA